MAEKYATFSHFPELEGYCSSAKRAKIGGLDCFCWRRKFTASHRLSGRQIIDFDMDVILASVLQVIFTAADDALLHGILNRHLKHDFGYRYFSSPRGFQG